MHLAFAITPQAPSVVTTVGEFFEAGGLLMWPILGCSILVVGLALERYLSLRKARVLPQVVVDAAYQVCEGNAKVIEAGILEADAPAARILAAGLRRRGCLLADVERAVEDRLHQEAQKLRGNVRGVWLVASIAPLLGLLGTVLGIADAFAAVEQTGLGTAESSESLAAGIKVALYTTIFGLFVAIPATLLAAHLQGRARRLAAEIADVLAPTIEALASLPATATHHAGQERADTRPSGDKPPAGKTPDGGPEETHAA